MEAQFWPGIILSKIRTVHSKTIQSLQMISHVDGKDLLISSYCYQPQFPGLGRLKINVNKIQKKDAFPSVAFNFSPCNYHCDDNCPVELRETSVKLVARQDALQSRSAFWNE